MTTTTTTTTIDRWSYPCWTPDHGIWKCNVESVQVPSTLAPGSGNVGRVFRKQYMNGQNLFPGNCAQGQLTELGMAQHLANGAEFYDFLVTRTGLLSSDASTNNGKIFLRGDDEARVLQSGESLLLGMFTPPPSPGNDESIWSIHTMDELLDDMTPNGNLCPLYQQYQDEWVKSPGYLSHYSQVTLPLLQRFAAASGQPAGWAATANPVNVFDCLNSHICHNMPIPSGVDQQLYEEIVAEATWNWRAQFSYPDIVSNARAGIGHLISQIAGRLTSQGNVEPFTLFSGHDDTLIPVLNALGVWDQFRNGTWVPYASYLTFEVYEAEASQAKHLRIVFNGQVLTLPVGCSKSSQLCDLGTAIKYNFEPLFPAPNNCSRTDGTPAYSLNHKAQRYGKK